MSRHMLSYMTETNRTVFLGTASAGRDFSPPTFIKREHCTALRAMQHPSMTPTSLLGVWGGEY